VITSMVMMHYYARPEVMRELGYLPERVVAIPLRVGH
jgi:hypothetical protein